MRGGPCSLVLAALLTLAGHACPAAEASDLAAGAVEIPETSVFQSLIELSVQLQVSAVIDYGYFEAAPSSFAGKNVFDEPACPYRSPAFHQPAGPVDRILDAWCHENDGYTWRRERGVIAVRAPQLVAAAATYEAALDVPLGITGEALNPEQDPFFAIEERFLRVAEERIGKGQPVMAVFSTSLNGPPDWLSPVSPPAFTKMAIQPRDSLRDLFATSLTDKPHHLWLLDSAGSVVSFQATNYLPGRGAIPNQDLIHALLPGNADAKGYPDPESRRIDAAKEFYRRLRLDRKPLLAALADAGAIASLLRAAPHDAAAADTVFRLMGFHDVEVNGLIIAAVKALPDNERQPLVIRVLPRPNGTQAWNETLRPMWTGFLSDPLPDIAGFAKDMLDLLAKTPAQ